MAKPNISKLLEIISSEISRESGSNSGAYDARHKPYDRHNQKNRMRQENYRNKNYMREKNPNKK